MKNRTQFTVRAADIQAILNDPSRGKISLVGDHGGTALITSNLEPSSLVFGTMGIETEHGTIYLDPEVETVISEETPFGDHHEWQVAWTIDGHGSSPEQAAARTWIRHFGRTMASDDDACIFTVTDPGTNRSVTVDLSKFDLETLTD